MNVFEFVLGVVIVAFIGRTIQIWLTTRAGSADQGPAPTTPAAQDEVRQLKERIQVLERVITDNHGRSDLDREIERLRDR